jgi:hypothetical protein
METKELPISAPRRAKKIRMASACESSDILRSDCHSVIFSDAISAVFVDGYKMQVGFAILTYS